MSGPAQVFPQQKVGCEAYEEFGFSFWFQMY